MFRGRLSGEEQKVAELRSQGHDWESVARELGGTPEGRRKQLARAVARVGQELGLDPVGGSEAPARPCCPHRPRDGNRNAGALPIAADRFPSLEDPSRR